MTDAEYQRHRVAGTCFRCGQRYTPTQLCPPGTLNVLIGDHEEEEQGDDVLAAGVINETVDDTVVQLSKLTSLGIDGPQTLKLRGEVQGRGLILMVDSGATHCFISDQTVKLLQWPIIQASRFAVTLENGSRVQTKEMCKDLPITINSEVYRISCYIFPLSSVDVILGVSWLATLGDVKANWAKLTLQFDRGGR